MAEVVITLKIMPEGVDSNLETIEKNAKEKISKFGGEVGKVNINEVAFGLKSVELLFVMDEAKGSTEDLEKQIEALDEVNSVEVTDVRRAIG
jgi:elongation factor 1-beta